MVVVIGRQGCHASPELGGSKIEKFIRLNWGPINVPYFSLSSCLTFEVHFNLVAGFFCHRVFLPWFSVMLDAIVDFGVTNGPAARTYWT